MAENKATTPSVLILIVLKSSERIFAKLSSGSGVLEKLPLLLYMCINLRANKLCWTAFLRIIAPNNTPSSVRASAAFFNNRAFLLHTPARQCKKNHTDDAAFLEKMEEHHVELFS